VYPPGLSGRDSRADALLGWRSKWARADGIRAAASDPPAGRPHEGGRRVNRPPEHATDSLEARLGTRGPVVLPALLLCDYGHLADEVVRLE